MSASPEFDKAAAHRFFSADCFNQTWTLIDKPNRSAEEDEQMLLLSLASLWHWTQREDCSERNLSIGYWQVSRVYALRRDGLAALGYGEICLRHSQDQPPFFLAYAHETIARAASLNGDSECMSYHIGEARRLATQVTDVEERAAPEKDLDTIRIIK
jgi:hypothetical protein